MAAIEADGQLLEHLQNCAGCAADAAAAKNLQRLLECARPDDTHNIIPIEENRERIEARVAAGKDEGKISHPSTSKYRRARRYVLSFGTMLAVAILAILTLIPFKYNRVVGYEIALDGVDKELAWDIERICDMLFNLGLDDAVVDVYGCEATCSLLIVDIKTEEEAQRVVAAFTEIDPANLNSNVIPIRAVKSATLLDQANETLLRRGADIN
jgi:hypothetical protein